MRILATALTYVVSLLAIAAITFVVVIFLAGPHAGLLPSWLEPVVIGLGWLAILVLPILVARKVWRRLSKSGAPDSSSRARQP